MFAKIFKRVSIQAFIASFFLCFFANLFVIYCTSLGTIKQEAFLKTLGFSFLFIVITILVTLSENKKLNAKFGAIHLLSFPLAILLFNQEGTLDLRRGLIGLFLLIALNVYTRDLKQKQPIKEIFLLSVLITSISFFNYNFVLFYTVPFLFFIEPQYRRLKNGIILITGIVCTAQFLMVCSYFLTGHFFYKSNNLSTIDFQVSETLWLIAINGSVLTAFFFRSAQYKNTLGKNGVFRAFQFMFIWLIISILFRYLNLYHGNERWLLSFIPTAFFLGFGLEYLKNNLIKNLFILAIIIIAVYFRLHQYNLIPF